MNSHSKRIAAVMAALAIILVTAFTAQADQRVIKGTLVKVENPQPRSPEYAVDLDEPVMIGETVLTKVEVSAKDTDMEAMTGKKVVATGSFVQWKTAERGSFVVMEVCEINLQK